MRPLMTGAFVPVSYGGSRDFRLPSNSGVATNTGGQVKVPASEFVFHRFSQGSELFLPLPPSAALPPALPEMVWPASLDPEPVCGTLLQFACTDLASPLGVVGRSFPLVRGNTCRPLHPPVSGE